MWHAKHAIPYLFGLAPWGIYKNLKSTGGTKPRWGTNPGGCLAKHPERDKKIQNYSQAAHKSQNNMKIRMRISNSFYEQENVLINEAPKLSQTA